MTAGSLADCVEKCDLSGFAVQASRCLQECAAEFIDSPPSVKADPGGLSVAVSVSLAILLVPLTGLFAGLTLGLLSLDLVGLKILEQGGEPHERQYARKIIPVRKQGNLLLCTLLFGNTVINSAISILLADLTTGFIGLLVATFIILIFGEIVPQSICTQKEMGLKIGAHSIWLVKAFTIILCPIVWPISKVLDHCLGRDIGTVYSQEELKRLIDIHVSDPDAQAESGLTCADQKLIIGALEYKDKLVRDVMTSLEQIFMLERTLRLTFQTMLAIYKSGFTRIPVYEGRRANIVGILYVKDLILIDPDDEVEISAVVSFRGCNAKHVSENEPLDRVFKLFMTSSNHMLLAHDENSVVTGLITLEDVMEELIQAEIVDETDVYENVNTRLPRQVAARVDLATFMMIFEHKLRHQQVLSSAEVAAVAAFLSLNVDEFAKLAEYDLPLKGLISHAEVLEQEAATYHKGSPNDSIDTTSPSPPMSHRHSLSGGASPAHLLSRGSHSLHALQQWEDGHTQEASHNDALVLYEHGVASDAFTVLLQGRAIIRTGIESFELELGPWSILGNKALSSKSYVPDFSAVIWPPYRVLRIRRAAYQAAVEATRLGPAIHQRARLVSADAAADLRLPDAQIPTLPRSVAIKLPTPKRLSTIVDSGTTLQSSPALPVNSAADAVRKASPTATQASSLEHLARAGSTSAVEMAAIPHPVGRSWNEVGRSGQADGQPEDEYDNDRAPLLPPMRPQ